MNISKNKIQDLKSNTKEDFVYIEDDPFFFNNQPSFSRNGGKRKARKTKTKQKKPKRKTRR